MNTISLPLAVSIAIVSLLVGLVAGYTISPRYQQTMFETEVMGLGAADRYVDLRYLNQMAAHHQAAILLAKEVADKTNREEIKHLALEIQVTEPKLINELYAWKQAWYNDSSKISDPTIPNLGVADDTLDLRFLNALIAHHEDGIAMAQDIRTKSSRSEILDNANAVENFLANSLITLKSWRSDWYSIE
jgi:uncharacterized protein (DUF305 family)